MNPRLLNNRELIEAIGNAKTLCEKEIFIAEALSRKEDHLTNEECRMQICQENHYESILKPYIEPEHHHLTGIDMYIPNTKYRQTG